MCLRCVSWLANHGPSFTFCWGTDSVLYCHYMYYFYPMPSGHTHKAAFEFGMCLWEGTRLLSFLNRQTCYWPRHYLGGIFWTLQDYNLHRALPMLGANSSDFDIFLKVTVALERWKCGISSKVTVALERWNCGVFDGYNGFGKVKLWCIFEDYSGFGKVKLWCIFEGYCGFGKVKLVYFWRLQWLWKGEAKEHFLCAKFVNNNWSCDTMSK